MVEHYKDEIRAGEEIAKVLATEAEKAKERQRQEEILRQERAEEDRKAREEAERIRIRAEQLDADTESSTEENIINGFIVIIIIMTLFVLFKQF